MAFINDEDYSVQARQDVLTLLDNTENNTTMRKAENYAMSQINMRLAGRYNMAQVFNQTGDNRNAFIVMITIDIAIYHLYSQKAPRKIPEYRDIRYRDAMDWLEDVGNGKTPTDLPPIASDDYTGQVRIMSVHKPNNHKY